MSTEPETRFSVNDLIAPGDTKYQITIGNDTLTLRTAKRGSSYMILQNTNTSRIKAMCANYGIEARLVLSRGFCTCRILWEKLEYWQEQSVQHAFLHILRHNVDGTTVSEYLSKPLSAPELFLRTQSMSSFFPQISDSDVYVEQQIGKHLVGLRWKIGIGGAPRVFVDWKPRGQLFSTFPGDLSCTWQTPALDLRRGPLTRSGLLFQHPCVTRATPSTDVFDAIMEACDAEGTKLVDVLLAS